MTDMTMGANVPISVPGVRATLRWMSGPGLPEVDASALLLGTDGQVTGDADFVFYNQPEHASGSVRMVGKTTDTQSADAIDVALLQVPAWCQRVVLAASADGGTFGQVPGLALELTDAVSGASIARFPMAAGTETAFVCAEIYRRDAGWRFRAIGQGYASGLSGLATDFGIDVGAGSTEAPTASPPAAAPPAGPQPTQPATPAAPPPAAPTPSATPSATASATPSGRNLLDLDTPL